MIHNEQITDILQIGLRTLEQYDNPYFPKHNKVKYLSGYDIFLGKHHQTINNLNKSIPVYITFDIDCLAYPVHQETGTPEIGGLHYYQALFLLIQIFEQFEVVGLDIVELQSAPTNNINFGQQFSARFVLEYLLSKMPFRPM